MQNERDEIIKKHSMTSPRKQIKALNEIFETIPPDQQAIEHSQPMSFTSVSQKIGQAKNCIKKITGLIKLLQTSFEIN